LPPFFSDATMSFKRMNKPLKISKIVIDRDACIGAAPCVTVAPGVFKLDDENKATLVDPNGADADTILLAAQSCPVQAISIFDEQGRQVYP
jgi:ferredoxin